MSRRVGRPHRRERKAQQIAARGVSLGESFRTVVRDARRRGVPIRTDAADALPKMSETFNEYAGPVLETVPEDATRAQLTDALSIAYACWNVATGDAATDDECLAKLLSVMADAHVETNLAMQALLRALIRRRREEFSWDPRRIAAFEVLEKDGEFRIAAVSLVPTPDAKP